MRTKPSSVSAKEISAYVRTLVHVMCHTFKRKFQQLCVQVAYRWRLTLACNNVEEPGRGYWFPWMGEISVNTHNFSFVIDAISLSTTNCSTRREMFLQSVRVPILEEISPRVWKSLWRICHVSTNYTHVAMMRKNAHISFSEARTHFSLSSNLPRHLTVT